MFISGKYKLLKNCVLAPNHYLHQNGTLEANNDFRTNYICKSKKTKKHISIQSPTGSFLKHEMAFFFFFSIQRLCFLQLNSPFHILTTSFAPCFLKLKKGMSTNIILVRATITNKELLHSFFAEFEQLQPDQVFLHYMKIEK